MISEDVMLRKKNTDTEHDDGSYVTKKSKKSSIFAFILCVLIAIVVWAYAEATETQRLEAESSAVTQTEQNA